MGIESIIGPDYLRLTAEAPMENIRLAILQYNDETRSRRRGPSSAWFKVKDYMMGLVHCV